MTPTDTPRPRERMTMDLLARLEQLNEGMRGKESDTMDMRLAIKMNTAGELLTLLPSIVEALRARAEGEAVARVDEWESQLGSRLIVNMVPWDRLPLGTLLYAHPAPHSRRPNERD